MMTADGRILMVVTSCGRIDAEHPTGLWLEEFAVPYLAFREAGWAMSVASPMGGKTPVDPRSAPTEEEAQRWVEPLAALEQTLPLATVEADGFAAIFLPGGHGTMFDLPENAHLRRLLRAFAGAGKVIAAVCHGPAGLVGATLADGAPLVTDKRLTAFTDAEEREVRLAETMPFLLEARLRELGARFVAAPNWTEHVEVDGVLVTGQNPQSSAAAAQAVLELLGKRR